MRNLITVVALVLALALPSVAASFINGGFEDGNWNGWTQGGGYWYGAPVSPTDYLPGGSQYNMGGNRSAIVTAGNDPITGLPMVYNGSYAARVNDSSNMYHVSVISQTVLNYTDTNIYFAWSAVLQASHGVGDSDYFALKLTDDTQGDTLYAVSYDSASTPGYFQQIGSWYYSGWQIANLDVSARIGHTFTLTLLGSDCPYGGHGGYVYLDGFGATPPPPGPEPTTMSLVLLGAGSVVLARLRRRRA